MKALFCRLATLLWLALSPCASHPAYISCVGSSRAKSNRRYRRGGAPELPTEQVGRGVVSFRRRGRSVQLELPMARFNFEFEEDFYFTLNVTRDADRSEIRRNYRLLARNLHPDKFVEELKFNPEKLSTKQILAYLDSERVVVLNKVEKGDIIDLARKTHKRTQNVDIDLANRRLEIMNRFALLNEAYTTLYDDEKRRMYDLSGDWGIPGLSGKKKTGGGMGDREEAARVRSRREAAQRSPIQERVYNKYMADLAEQERAEAEFVKQREEKKAREKEERRKERERLGLKDEDEMTDEERRIENQERIKAMWGNIFSNVFDTMTGEK